MIIASVSIANCMLDFKSKCLLISKETMKFEEGTSYQCCFHGHSHLYSLLLSRINYHVAKCSLPLL